MQKLVELGSYTDVNFVCTVVHHPDCMDKYLHLLKREGICVTTQCGVPKGWITENKKSQTELM